MNMADALIDAFINGALQDSTFKPPSILYKYLSDERVKDVLGNGSVRFTPLSNTNDLFEVRASFKNFAGTNLIKRFEDAMQKVLGDYNFNSQLKKHLDGLIKKNDVTLIHHEDALNIYNETTGKKVIEAAKNIAIKYRETELIPSLNSEKQTNKLLDAIGKKLCFSLSECENINLMWAHYANSHKGFVIAFDTESAWFKEWKDGESKSLIKVPYFDDKIEEPLDNPLKAIFSKKTDWEYEREWRIVAEEYQADEKTPTQEPMYLMNFPPEAVQRIILGTKINPEVESRIKEIVDAKYPHAKIYRMRSNPVESCLEEVKV